MALSSDQTRAQPPSDSDRTAMPPTSPMSGAIERAPADDALGEPTLLALPVGTRLNEFEITGTIGEGGFGIVYAAHDHSLDRAVALKEYMPGALAMRTQGVSVSVRSNRHRETFELGLKSFVNEARLLARFDHPSLVKVYRFWEAHGTAYMVMPHYQGETLKSRLKRAGASPDEAWLRKLLASLLEALEVIHQENVFHRDIAPDNILLLEADVPVLLDFGAARRVIGDATQGLTVILKPGYAPVEQYAEVKSMKQGAWTDVYALAATVHFAIHGKPPEPAVARMLSDTFVPLTQSARGRYSEGFLAAMDAALRVKPEDRPQNVAAFRALLGGGAGPQSASRAESRPAKTQQPSLRDAPPRRSNMPLIATAVALVAAVGAGGYFYYVQRDAAPTVPTAPAGATPPEPVAARTPSATPPEPVAPAPSTEVAKPSSEPEKAPETTPPPPRPELVKPPTAEPTPPAVVTKPAPVVAKPPPGADERPVVRADVRPDAKAAAPKPPPKQANPDIDQQAYRQPEPPRDNVQVTAWVAQAQQSLARREFRRAIAFADSALSLDPANAQARDIRRRAQEGEKRAFEEIKIE